MYFHLDTRGTLRSGLVLDLIPAPLGGRTPAEVAEIERWFPRGVSHFGLELLFGRAESEEFLRQEATLEAIRRRLYPYCSSRSTSFFAFASIEDFRRYREQGSQPGRIWKLEAAEGFRGDMNLFPYCFGDWEKCAHTYWSQGQSDHPLFEYLLQPPIHVLEEVVDDQSA